MAAKVVSIRPDNSNALLDLQDALNRQYDRAWAMAGLLEGLQHTYKSKFMDGAIVLAHDHIDALDEIRKSLEAVRARD